MPTGPSARTSGMSFYPIENLQAFNAKSLYIESKNTPTQKRTVLIILNKLYDIGERHHVRVVNSQWIGVSDERDD